MKRLFFILAGVALVANLNAVSPLEASTASFDINTPAYNEMNTYTAPQTIGYIFTPSVDIIISSLGFYDSGNDGLGESHVVGIFDNSTRELLTSATVSSGTGSTLQDGFRYTDITTPITLSAGHYYTAAALLPNQIDKIGYAYVSNIDVNPDISLASFPTRYIIGAGSVLTFPNSTTDIYESTFWYGPNFQLTSVPLPAAVWLLGAGFIRMACYGKKFFH